MDVRKPNSFQKKTGKIRKVLCIELKKSYLCEVVPLSVEWDIYFSISPRIRLLAESMSSVWTDAR